VVSVGIIGNTAQGTVVKTAMTIITVLWLGWMMTMTMMLMMIATMKDIKNLRLNRITIECVRTCHIRINPMVLHRDKQQVSVY
jgi:hypothetical protein